MLYGKYVFICLLDFIYSEHFKVGVFKIYDKNLAQKLK